MFHRLKLYVTKNIPLLGVLLISFIVIIFGLWQLQNYQTQTSKLLTDVSTYEAQHVQTAAELSSVSAELIDLKGQDQIAINKALVEEIENIQKTFGSGVEIYESLVKLREQTTKTAAHDGLFAKALTELSKRNYTSGSATLSELTNAIKKTESEILAAASPPPISAPANNTAPGSGYSRQKVTSDAGEFLVSIIAGDLGSTRVIVDTASDSDCGDNCPVMSLATYAARSGAYAGINGSYFCPASYPSCAGKTNTFDLLAMNKNKYYFNSGNNVYSTNPAVIFGGGWVRFVGAASEWGRDTGVDGVLSNYPLLVSGGNVAFGGDDDPKKGSKGNRSFVASKGNTVYIGVVHSATVAETARVLKAMGMEHGLNLDNGGSTALWSGGYKVGPGRDLPNVILFVRK